ncbi:MFS transporter [Streptomyces sp. NPDC004279]
MAVRSTYLVFAALGLAGATWVSRLPQIRERMDLDAASVGLLLLLIAVGGVMVLPLAGTVVTRRGPRRTVSAVAVLVGIGLGAVALGFAFWPPLLFTGLFLLGTATGFWDVAVTVHAAAVERRLGRVLMSRFFAGFSLGTVTGACLGALMSALRVPVGLHIGAVAIIVTLLTPWAARSFLSEPGSTARSPRVNMPGAVPGAWREPRMVLIGLVALAFALAEGAGSNWSASPSSTVTTPRPPSAPSPMPRSSRRSRWGAGSGRLSSTASGGPPRCARRPVRPPSVSSCSRAAPAFGPVSPEHCYGERVRRSDSPSA